MAATTKHPGGRAGLRARREKWAWLRVSNSCHFLGPTDDTSLTQHVYRGGAMAMTDITAKYRPSMSWSYDRVVADAALRAVSTLRGHVRTATAEGGAVLEVGCGGG